MRLQPSVAWLVVGSAVIGGCAAAPRTDVSGALTRALRISPASSAKAVMQQATKASRPPLVLLSGNRVGTYFEGRITVDENAHVLVVAVDLDRQVRVLFPASPRQTGMVAANRALQLPPFYPRMGNPASSVRAVSPTDPNAGDRRSLTAEFGSSGSIVVIASRAGLDFSAFTTSDGDWNLQTMRRAVLSASVSDVVATLGGAVTAPGHTFGADHWVRIF